uniref:ATP synthase complex subunit 8 n=1 Tax=Staphylinidae sp. BMNH 1274206 TaxID=1796557 RepID=A0A140EGR4_9COLE|nr:ATP synthase F0 subunit 8 [Staphylinidae sp. BMNH 1274206]
MPQMAPMNWLLLFIMFIMVFMLFNALNYFCFMYYPKSLSLKTSTKINNWKW